MNVFRGIGCFCLSLLLVACGSAPQSQTTSSSTQSSPPSGSSDSSGPSSAPAIPPTAKTISYIQKMTGWGSCSSSCAGQSGTNAIYSMEQPIASPSLSGSAMKFDVTGGTPWGDVIWWKNVDANDAITHFVLKMSYYLDDPSAAQALEFYVSQNAGGNRYEFGTQCDIKGSGHWRIWPHSQMRWVDTGVPCPKPVANTWNQLVLEVSRNAQNQLVWEAVTLNGQHSVINQAYDSYPTAGSGIDVAFQMDSDGGPTPWSVWVDDVSLAEW